MDNEKQQKIETTEQAKEYLLNLLGLIADVCDHGVPAGCYKSTEHVAQVSFAIEQMRLVIEGSELKMVNNGE